MRARAREIRGRPLGRPPSQGPLRVVPNEAATPWSRTSPAPRLWQPSEWHEEEEEAGGQEDLEGREDVGRCVRREKVARAHAPVLALRHPTNFQNGRPRRVPQLSANGQE